VPPSARQDDDGRKDRLIITIGTGTGRRLAFAPFLVNKTRRATGNLMNELFFTVPNFVLAAAMYTVLGRYIMALFFKPDSQQVIWRVFAQVTDPVIGAVRAITPRLVPDGLVMIFTLFWLLILRMMLFLVAVMFGFAPRIGG
jgi:uncharacterized protein YggT (Ycf19 family)